MLTEITAKVLPFLKDDVDTDQIIPARFLKGTTKTGFGQYMFYDWRYTESGDKKSDSPFDGLAEVPGILLASSNFGCGSSREHAPWALKDYGFKAIIAESFADIFYNNALKNQLLPVPLAKADYQVVRAFVESNPDAIVTIDVENQQVKLPTGQAFGFTINAFRKQCFINGMDDVDYVLNLADKITAFEQQHPALLLQK